jgi:copper(I)-binding protein
MSMVDGVMRMRLIEGGLEIPSGGAVELKPSGMHLMLIGLRRPLIAGENVAVTLVFAGGARLETSLEVRAVGSGHGY